MSGFLTIVSAAWWFVSWPFSELFRERDWIDVPLYEYEDEDETSLECADASAIRSLARGLAWCVAGLLTPFSTNLAPPLELYDEVDEFTLELADVAAIRAFARTLSWCLLALFALPFTLASGALPSSMTASTQTAPPVLTFTGVIPSSVISISPSAPARPTRSGPLPSSMAAKLSFTGPIPSSIVSISPAAPSKPIGTGQMPSSIAPTYTTTRHPTTVPGPVPSSMAPTFTTTRHPTTIPGPVPSSMAPTFSTTRHTTTIPGPAPSLTVPKTSNIPRLTTSSGQAPSSMGSLNEAAAAPSRNYKRGSFRFANPPPPARPNIPVGPPPSAPTFQFGSNVSPLPAVPPPSRLNSAGFSFGTGFMADAAETSRALNARAAGPVPATSAEEKGKKPEEIVEEEKEPELEKGRDTGVEEELGGNGPKESRQAKRAREKREKKEKKKEEEKEKTPPKGPSVREVLEGGAS